MIAFHHAIEIKKYSKNLNIDMLVNISLAILTDNNVSHQYNQQHIVISLRK